MYLDILHAVVLAQLFNLLNWESPRDAANPERGTYNCI
jgi:hypothetical protein